MTTKLPDSLLAQLRPLEDRLKEHLLAQDSDSALETAKRIQALFHPNRSHHRLLRAKLWAYEACVEANRLTLAEPGLIGIRQLTGKSTRLYLEASALLSVVYLRQKKLPQAKDLIREVISNISNIDSSKTRHSFQKRFIDRVEEECIFAELVGSGSSPLDAKEVEEKAIFLIQRSSDSEIYKLIGDNVPVAGVELLENVRSYSIQQLPAPDRKLIGSQEQRPDSLSIGKTTFAVLRRIAWKTLCKPDSQIYKLWSVKAPKLFNQGYFTAAIVATMNDFRIGIPLLASGIAAIAMKYSAEEFCELSKPKGIMSNRDDKDS